MTASRVRRQSYGGNLLAAMLVRLLTIVCWPLLIKV